MQPNRPFQHGRRLRVFLAEDDPQMRRLIADALRRDRHFVVEASDGAALLQHLSHPLLDERPEAEHSVIISDVRMPRRNGLDVLAGLRALDWRPRCILITAFADLELHAEARRVGVHAVFDKPFDIDDLRAAVNDLAGTQGLAR